MKLKNYLVMNESIAKTLSDFSTQKLPISILFKVDPVVAAFNEARKKINLYRIKVFEKHGALKEVNEKGEVIRYTVDGCPEETKEAVWTEIRDLLEQDTEFPDKTVLDSSKIDTPVSKEDWEILKLFFDFK